MSGTNDTGSCFSPVLLTALVTTHIDVKFTFFTARLHDHSMFESNPVVSHPLPAYDSLHDPHLEEYFIKKFNRINATHKYTEFNVSMCNCCM